MKYLYHATVSDNLDSIYKNGLIPQGFYNAVFLADNPESAAAFLKVRLINNITVLRVKFNNNQFRKLDESFDHSDSFFRCRAYMCYETITPERLKKIKFDA